MKSTMISMINRIGCFFNPLNTDKLALSSLIDVTDI